VSPVAATDPEFIFGDPAGADPVRADVQAANPLGPLADLPGTWVGRGFNAIWRPHHPSVPQDRFLELNLTDDTIAFTAINGPIPNRGLQMPDISMFGVTYMQQIHEHNQPANGLHIEPGIWAFVPQTTDPAVPPTVVRMASIPHGTTVELQGLFQVIAGGPPQIPDNNILPFFFGQQPQPNSAFASVAGIFPELDLSIPTTFRFAPPGVTQAMVVNPNSVLQQALQASLQGTTMKSRTFLHVQTPNDPRIHGGGGLANTAFLAAGSLGGNAKCTQVDATFWIETIAGKGGQPDVLQLQYTQTVMLDFNGIHWPHVTVGTLVKQ
jgi:hypothetical protein